MPEDIYITSIDEKTGQALILESNTHSLWAYILDPDLNQIKMDGFVCSLIEPPEYIETPIDKTSPPPLLKQYSNGNSFIENLREDQLKISWNNDEVMIFIDDSLYLVLNMETKTSKSKSLSKAGPYGSPL